jgi:hypothetical protein
MISDDISSLGDIKKDKYVIEHIIWDFEPKQLMEPRCRITAEGKEFREPIKGYLFYIDTIDEKPALFLMRHTYSDCAETVAKIDEIPEELLLKAIDENKDKEYFSMYPINKNVENWLKKQLGIED